MCFEVPSPFNVDRLVVGDHGLLDFEIFPDFRTATIRNLIVDTNHRGNGIGTALLTQFENKAINREVHTINLLADKKPGELRHPYSFYCEHGYYPDMPRDRAEELVEKGLPVEMIKFLKPRT